MDKSKKTAIHGEMPQPPTENHKAILQLGEYLLETRPIYTGVCGNIYGGKRRNETENSLAIKFFEPAKIKSSWKYFQKEALLLQKLNHFSLTRIVDFGKTTTKDDFLEDIWYLVMEFAHGTALSQKNYSNITSDLIFRWAFEIIQGLLYLHDHEIVHNDLTPNNIFILSTAQEGRSVKLLDFGISLTKSNKQAGTLRYMSLEQLDGQNVTFASDIYAFGIIFYELIYCEYPYSTPDVRQDNINTWCKIHNQDVITRNPKSQSIDISDVIQAMIHKCLEKNPNKRPTAKEIITILQKEISGVGNPSYIAIVGARSSGKTCFLTSLYKQIEPLPETSEILEKNCLALYENGTMPSATALAFFRLEFFIHAKGVSHHVVTRDYGGELLQQDYAAKLQEKGANTSFFEQKREELYEFFQSARAILIMIETKPSEKNLQQILRYRSEIFSIIQRLASVNFNKRRIQIPISIVLTKWDRMGDISWDCKTEMDRAHQYVQETDWLKNIHEQLLAMCPTTDVFPVFSFIGDKPSVDNIRSFNLAEPLIWSHVKGEESLFAQCEEFAKNHSTSYASILENYWRLLHIEKIDNPEIIQKIENRIDKYAQEYHKYLKRNVAKENDYRWVIGECQQFIQAKGVTTEQRRDIERKLQHWHKKKKNQNFWKITVPIVALLLLVYSTWEWIAYSRIQHAIAEFKRTNNLDSFFEEMYSYRKYKYVSVVRIFLEDEIIKSVEKKLESAIEQQLDSYKQTISIEPSPIRRVANFGKDLSTVKSELDKTNQNLKQCKYYISELTKIERWKQVALKNINNQRLQKFEVTAKLKNWQNKQTMWNQYLDFLKTTLALLKEILFLEKEGLKIITIATPFSKISYSLLETNIDFIRKSKKQIESWQEKTVRYLQKDISAIGAISDLQDQLSIISSLHLKLKDLEDMYITSQYHKELEKYKQSKDDWNPENLSNLTMLKDKEQHLKQYLEKFRISLAYLQKTSLLDKKILETWQENFTNTIQEIETTLVQYRYIILKMQIAQASIEAEALSTDSVATITAKQGIILEQLDEVEKWLKDVDILRVENSKKLELKKILDQRKKNLNDYFAISNKIKETREKEQRYITYYQKIENLWQESRSVSFSQDDPLSALKNKQKLIGKILDRWQNFSLHSQDFLLKDYQILSKNREEYLQKTTEKQREVEKIIEEQIQEQLYQKQTQELSKIRQKGMMNLDFASESFSSLESKKSIIDESLNNVKKWRILDKVSKNYFKRLQEQKQLLLKELDLHQQYLENISIKIHSLDNEIKDITKTSFFRSYKNPISTLKTVLEKVQKNDFLNRIHKNRLESLLFEIEQKRKADIESYKNIMHLKKESKFLNMYKKIQEYKNAITHNRVMEKSFDTYIQSWSCIVNVSVDLETNIDDSGAPQMYLEIYKPEKVILTGNTTKLYQGWYKGNVGVFVITPIIKMSSYKINIHVWEDDSWGDDDCGECTIDIVKLLNNEKVYFKHTHSSTVNFTFTPTIKGTPSFPGFKE